MADTLSDSDAVKDFFSRVKLTDNHVASYYRFFYVFRSILEQHNIECFAHSGTMLGAIRHRGLIPWDDDIDVMIEECFEDALVSIVPELESYGVVLQKKLCEHLYQFNCKSLKISPANTFLQIDVFVGQRQTINDKTCLHYKTREFREDWFPRRHVVIDELYPLKEYEFGPLTIRGLRQYDNFFEQCGFSLEEGVVARHLNFDHFKPEIERLTQQGLHPIRDKDILAFRHEIPAEDVIRPLGEYRLL